jgi:hypothetical protein
MDTDLVLDAPTVREAAILASGRGCAATSIEEVSDTGTGATPTDDAQTGPARRQFPCPACGHLVSVRAKSCPQCGDPLESFVAYESPGASSAGNLHRPFKAKVSDRLAALILLGLIVAGGAVAGAGAILGQDTLIWGGFVAGLVCLAILLVLLPILIAGPTHRYRDAILVCSLISLVLWPLWLVALIWACCPTRLADAE